MEAVSITGLGACQMQWRLMVDKGMNLLTDPKQVSVALAGSLPKCSQDSKCPQGADQIPQGPGGSAWACQWIGYVDSLGGTPGKQLTMPGTRPPSLLCPR